MEMVDDRKNIEKRMQMNKMAGLFMGKKRLVMAIGILCVVILGGALLTNDKSTNTEDGIIAGWDIDLLKYKSPYIRDASNVSNLLNELPFGEYKDKLALDTEKEPYGLSANYDLTKFHESHMDFIYKTILRNSAVLFCLIENLDTIRYNIKMGNSSYNYEFTRNALQKIYFDQDLRAYSKNQEEFAKLISPDAWPSTISSYFISAGVDLNKIEEIRIEYFEGDSFKNVQIVDSNLITKLIDDLNTIELLPLAQMGVAGNLSNGVYIVLNTGEKDNYFYIDYNTGGISKHMPVMSSLPAYIYRFENTEELKSAIDYYTLSP